ncbi:MAG: hypothetical protein LBQ54_00890 [Planctomycetaceae bacterium]|jgi:hypothetical protein|nr:hypothetical protein [Planctomycetaceae bacterium]
MATARTTSTEMLALYNTEELIGLINLVSAKLPEFTSLYAVPIEKTKYKAMIQTALPAAGFRLDNIGREEQKPTWSTIDVECKFMDASWSIDEKVAMDHDNLRADEVCALQSQAALQSALTSIASQTWYGTTADANGFVGIASLLNLTTGPNVVNAGGTAANAQTSLYAVSTGLQRVAYAWGQGGVIREGELMYLPVSDASTPAKTFWGFRQSVSGYVGLQIPSVKCIGRIVNIDAAHPLTDNLISQLLEKFEPGFEPDMFFTSKRAVAALQRSRTATNPTGAPAPFPDSAFNIPIYESSAIKVNEPVVAAS